VFGNGPGHELAGKSYAAELNSWVSQVGRISQASLHQAGSSLAQASDKNITQLEIGQKKQPSEPSRSGNNPQAAFARQAPDVSLRVGVDAFFARGGG
jgi:hypothetical protein